jgi:hypothetical protein
MQADTGIPGGLAPLATPKTSPNFMDLQRGRCSTPQSRRRGSGKFGSSGAAAVAAIALNDTTAFGDVQTFIDDSVVAEARCELLKSTYLLEEEIKKSSMLEETVAKLQQQLSERALVRRLLLTRMHAGA